MPQDNDYNITNLNYYRNLFRNQKEKKQELQPGHNKQEKAWHKLLSRPIITTKDLQEIENFKDLENKSRNQLTNRRNYEKKPADI